RVGSWLTPPYGPPERHNENDYQSDGYWGVGADPQSGRNRVEEAGSRKPVPAVEHEAKRVVERLEVVARRLAKHSVGKSEPELLSEQRRAQDDEALEEMKN